jgi:hypothetical protein
MELAVRWHRCQNLQKASEYFLQQYTGGEMILSRRDWRIGEPEKALLAHQFKLNRKVVYPPGYSPSRSERYSA